jgi:PAS domain S-box-containing protein
MTPQRILIVEDDDALGRELQDTLVAAGFSVPHVPATGSRAIELAGQIDPDLVLMDVSVNGDPDGIAAAMQIGDERGVVYLAGPEDEKLQQRARATTHFGFVTKPYVARDLVETIRAALSRHESLRRLEVSERRFVSTMRSMADGVIMTDLAGNITYLNPTAEEITGWTGEEASGRPLKEVFHIRDRDGSEADALPVGSDGRGGRSIVLTKKSGDAIIIEDNTAPIRDDAGGLTGLVVVFRERVRRGAQGGDGFDDAREGEHLVRMVESIVDPMFTMDSDWRITYVNQQAAGYFGATRDEVLGRVFWDDFPRSVRERYLPEFTKTLRDFSPQHFEFFHEAKKSWFEVNSYPFADGVLALFKDITERKNSEEEQAKIEKLEGLGFLARGFAHDFNNLLTVLLGNLSLATSRVPEDADYREDLVTAKTATVQAQNLVQQLLTFAKGGAPIKRRIEIGRVVESVVRECQVKRRERGVNYFCNVEPGLWPLHGDESQLLRMLHNLIRNAEQAMPSGGDLMVHCKNLEAASALPDEALHLDPDVDYMLIKVYDDGEGIAEAIRQRVFEPYFSGWPDTNASGLGLTVCESIVKAHGGFMVLDSREGYGTTVNVYLPALGPASGDRGDEEGATRSGETAGKSPASTLIGGHSPAGIVREVSLVPQRILVLEDELLIRELIARNLTEAGYEVHQAAEGASAVHAYKEAMRSHETFDLVLMDLSIPEGIGGAEAMAQIRRIDPEVVAIVSSGYSDDPVMANHEKYGFSGVLPKPYDPMELRRLVAEVIERRGAPKA